MPKLKDVMTPNVECVRPGDTLQEAARKMKALDVGPMPVCGENNQVVGILTDRDITVRATAEGKDPRTTTVEDAMSQDVIWCFEDQNSDDAADVMQKQQIRRLLVMSREKRLVGIVSLADLAKEGKKKKKLGETLQAVSEPAQSKR